MDLGFYTSARAQVVDERLRKYERNGGPTALESIKDDLDDAKGDARRFEMQNHHYDPKLRAEVNRLEKKYQAALNVTKQEEAVKPREHQPNLLADVKKAYIMHAKKYGEESARERLNKETKLFLDELLTPGKPNSIMGGMLPNKERAIFEGMAKRATQKIIE